MRLAHRATTVSLAFFAAAPAWAWHPGPQVPVGPEDLGVTLDEPGRLRAVDGDRVATATVGDSVVTEESEWGRSVLATVGPVGGLARGPRSWTWSVPSLGLLEDVTRRRTVVAESPGLLASGDLDGNGIADLVVAHPGRIGVMLDGGDREVLYDLDGELTGLAVVDADGNGCGDLLVRRGESVTAVLGACGDDPEPLPSRPTVVIGDAGAEVRATVGEILTVQLSDGQGRATSWSKRGGPGGLFVNSQGILTYLPDPDDVGVWTVTVRLEAGAAVVRRAPLRLLVYRAGATPPAPAPVATLPAPAPAVVDPAPALAVPAPGSFVGPEARPFAAPGGDVAAVYGRPRWRDTFWTPHGCAVAAGVAGGGTVDDSPDWERLGEPVFLSASPIVAVTCDGGKSTSRWGWFVGADSAPVYTYLMTPDLRGLHVLAGFAGMSYGGDTWQVGGYATAGILLAGAGGRLRWMPIRTRRGGLHGLDLRVTLLASQNPSAEGMLLYTYRIPDFVSSEP